MKQVDKASVSRRAVMRSGLITIAGCAWVPRAFSATAASSSDAETAGAGQSWTIGNDLTARTITFLAGKGLITERFTDLTNNVEFIRPGKHRWGAVEEFSFQCNGQVCTGSSQDFDLVSGEESVLPNGKSLTVRLRHKTLALDVSLVYIAYDRHAAIRKHLVLHNTGTTPLRISHLAIDALDVTLGPENETTLLTQYGTIPREIFYTGRSEDAALLVANGRTGTGIAVISEVPGYMKRTEIGGWNDADYVRIEVLYDTDLMPFERVIAAGEEFKTASGSLVIYRNGSGFEDPHWRLPSYTAQVLMRRVDAQGPPWIYNTWEPFERSINRDTVMELIDVAAAIGIDIFTIDDGWQQEYGANDVNLTSFPGGLMPILKAVESRGMRLGLWIPVAAIGPSTPDYRNHPEWASLDIDGKQKTTSTMGGDKVVMCMATPFRDAAADRIIDAIERFHLAYVKLDITTIFNAYGEAPGCWAKGHFHSTWAESLNRIYEGISHMTGRIYEKHPDVLLDLTFELWGQKHVIDAGLLAAGDLDWMSNVDDRQPDSAGTLQARQLLYQRAASMPVEAMLIGNIHAGLPNNEDSFATAIGSAPLFLGDLRLLSTADRQWFHEKMAWFKRLRKNTRISESFFPLGSWLQPTPMAWDGFARLAHSGNGLIAVFRNKSTEPQITVQLPLMPEGKFKVHSVISGTDLGVFAGADWIRGIPIRFTGSNTADVLEVSVVSA